jgi:hypothetical protein
VIQEAHDKSGEYMFWLADDWSNAPRTIQEKDFTRVEAGTKSPIGEDWKSPFKGKTVQDAIAFLKSAPEEVCVDLYHFAVLGEDFVRRAFVTIYRIGDEYLRGDEVDSVPCSVAMSTIFLSSMEPHMWEESKGARDNDDDPVM